MFTVGFGICAACYIYSQNTHYFAIKLSSSAICSCMYSVISRAIATNSTFINYPFVTMWISVSPHPTAPSFCKASTLLLITSSISSDVSFWIRAYNSSSTAEHYFNHNLFRFSERCMSALTAKLFLSVSVGVCRWNFVAVESFFSFLSHFLPREKISTFLGYAVIHFMRKLTALSHL